MFARLALLHDDGCQPGGGGRAAADARVGSTVPRLAGSSGPHHCSIRPNASLHLVRSSLLHDA